MMQTRRDWITGAGATAALVAAPRIARAAQRVGVRILETSDLHMFLRDWDYYHDKSDPTVGLNKVATYIGEARAQTPNVLYFDNGDLIQGSPLGDYEAGLAPSARPLVHPAVRALNALKCDGATLGNHEFNFGVDFLDFALRGAAFPFVCANLRRSDGSAYVAPYRILERAFNDADGAPIRLKIGIVGFTPPQIMIWDKANLEGRLLADDILSAARMTAAGLRDKCDLVIALAHSGIDAGPTGPGMENASLHLARTGLFDAILTGHSHKVFPGPDYAGRAEVDAVRGTLAGVPAVMPGFWGSHLGVVDLTLASDGDRWTVDGFAVEARPIYRREKGQTISLVVADAGMAGVVEAEHVSTRAWVAEPVGALSGPLHSYFVWAGQDPASALINEAQIAYARPLLQAGAHAHLPLLSAVAPFRTGYTPQAFIDLAAGTVALRDVADLYPYPNTLVVVRATGEMLVEWLEWAARTFNTIDPAASGAQDLVDRRNPAYNFDAIAGLRYEIDVARPARYGRDGRVVAPDARRVGQVTWLGKPLDPAQEFAVVTNNYRADGGGPFPLLDGGATILRAPDTNREAVLRYLRGQEAVNAADLVTPWRLKPLARAAAVQFDTGARAAAHLPELPMLRAVDGAPTGYARLAFDL